MEKRQPRLLKPKPHPSAREKRAKEGARRQGERRKQEALARNTAPRAELKTFIDIGRRLFTR